MKREPQLRVKAADWRRNRISRKLHTHDRRQRKRWRRNRLVRSRPWPWWRDVPTRLATGFDRCADTIDSTRASLQKGGVAAEHREQASQAALTLFHSVHGLRTASGTAAGDNCEDEHMDGSDGADAEFQQTLFTTTHDETIDRSVRRRMSIKTPYNRRDAADTSHQPNGRVSEGLVNAALRPSTSSKVQLVGETGDHVSVRANMMWPP